MDSFDYSYEMVNFDTKILLELSLDQCSYAEENHIEGIRPANFEYNVQFVECWSETKLRICSENRMEYLISAVAVLSSGAILTCVNNFYSKNEFEYVLNLSKTKYIFLSSHTCKKYYEVLQNLDFLQKIILYDDNIHNAEVILFINMSQANKFNNSDKSDHVIGPVKGVKITHKNLFIACQQPMPSSWNIVMLTTIPWSSTMGLLCALHGLNFGRTIVFLSKFNERQYFQANEKYTVGMLILVPPIIVVLCKSLIAQNFDTSSIEILYCGGATLNYIVISDVKVQFPHIKRVLKGYRMTETTGAITKETETNYRQGSVGKVVPGIIFKIVDVETRKILGDGETGEVCVKGLVLFEGYIGKDSKDDFDEEGFYKTGDIAYYDGDGFLYIGDRIKKLIKYKASQVAPSELEAMLVKPPAVKDVEVTGTPDALAGELPIAFIVKQPGINATETEIVNYVDNKVSPWKRLRGGVIFINEIPKTESGKIIRQKLREMINIKAASKL